jgi:PrtD family type I secretion system ABC transporter
MMTVTSMNGCRAMRLRNLRLDDRVRELFSSSDSVRIEEANALSGGNPIAAALRLCRTHFIYAAIFSGLINLLYLAPSIYMLQVYDRVVSTRGTATLIALTLVLGAALLCSAILDSVRMRLLQRASVRLEKLAADQVLDRVLGARGQDAASRSQAMRDFDTLRQTLTGPAVVALFDAPWAPIYIIVCFLLHPFIGMLALVASLLLIGIAWRTERATAGPVKQAGEQASSAYFSQDFSIRSAEVVRALGMRGAVVKRHMAQRLGAVALQGEATKVSGRYLAITKFLRMFIQSLALGVGALLAISGMISAGAIFASSLLISRALQPIEQIMGALRNTMVARTAYANVRTLCDSPGPSMALTLMPPPTGRLDVEQLTIMAPNRSGAVLSALSFAAQPGELIALVGPSGAGKTTLLRALSGGLLPDGGTIRIDGASYGDWDPDRLARYIGYAPQEPTLFPGTVRDNIARFQNYAGRGGEELDMAVIDAAKAAGAHDLILRLPNAYDTILGPGGTGLSAGQMQRLALARAMFDKPVLVLLDEPNAHLDGEGDTMLLRKLSEMKAAGATVIVSVHRTSILQIADKILLLQDGRIQAFGSKDEVLKPRDPNIAPGMAVAPARQAGEPPPLAAGGGKV